MVNEHTERDTVPGILDRLARGERVALVSDAGLPGISDPGEVLVRAAVEAGFAVEVIPGPSAAAAALVVSGLPTARFVFEGFLPRKGSARSRRLAAVATEERTVVLYEAPHRLARTVADLVAVCGPERRVVFARELTKLHEEVWRGTLGEAVARVAAVEPRGEHVLVLDGAPRPPSPPTPSSSPRWRRPGPPAAPPVTPPPRWPSTSGWAASASTTSRSVPPGTERASDGPEPPSFYARIPSPSDGIRT